MLDGIPVRMLDRLSVKISKEMLDKILVKMINILPA